MKTKNITSLLKIKFLVWQISIVIDYKGITQTIFTTLAILYGLILIENEHLAGYIISLLLGASGIFAFIFHLYHLRKGKPEFNSIISKTIIVSTFIVSIFQIALTLKALIH